ncbi:3-deoxy-D-manno-octulosonic acid transferase [Roseomonas sp. PWR1]|uniref:3-deoxy-D-manno-octulosonic acid transferase n=1 Tax=Roseomonas nitratireducens TaxID=2820810 RepID=A0ABS4ATR2_9PROT|nr:3-deoxy-D-manno-octulosonic acid transferase [Neoroseomonas nitratireducens]MBP0464156.1 3-deoxy-D-manno-octulosonic acid transferase [Neoroseomonas nitratireducens]
MNVLALAWRLAATALAPLMPLHLRRRAARGKEIADRIPERYGQGAARPQGPLLWLHAASVGETVSILPLIDALAQAAPRLNLLVTTGTVTSATLFARRLPAPLAPRVTHRFVPLDVPAWAVRFLDGWRPDAAVFVESELWPNLLAETGRRGIPLALVNARMSARSARWWGRAPGFARQVLSRFAVILAQGAEDAARLGALGARDVRVPGNLKYAAPPLPVEAAELERLRALVAGRSVWLAASTHPGEEALVLAAHGRLAPRHPGLLTIIVPRHPERGAEVAALAGDLPAARRSLGEDPGPGTAVLVADTLGELGLFYRLAALAFIGGSLVPHGGQNPLEPARLGCPVLLGPHTWNFAEILARMEAAGGLTRIDPGTDPAGALAEAVSAMLTNEARRRTQAGAALSIAAEEAGLPGRIAAALLPLLPTGDDRAAVPDGRGQAGPETSGPPKTGKVDDRV